MNAKKIRKQRSNSIVKTINVLVVIAFLVVIVFMGKIAIFKNVGGTDLIAFRDDRSVDKKTLIAERGNIYDVKGTPLAQTVPSYNLYAILSETYSKDQEEGEPRLHVTSPEKVAEGISPIIGMDKAMMLEILQRKGFQVEFAPYGRGLSQQQKDKIDALKLEGIYFEKRDARSYPQGAFASHILGYASYNNETEHLEGKMGLERQLNDNWLQGKDGYHQYQTNIHNQIIAEQGLEPAQNGSNVYLTIDAYIQHLVDERLKQIAEEHEPEWGVIAIADPKTGALLAIGQIPTFDPNVKEISNYTNYFTEAEYEVGSIMKSITFASAVDSGKYDGNRAVQTGKLDVDDWTISDWNSIGWGQVPTDMGLFYSSNTIIASLIDNVLTPDEQRDYLKAFGFGKTTDVEVESESRGTFALNNRVERITTGYGQGSTATVAQMVQAYNAIANKGKMMQLHFVDRVEAADGTLQYKHENKVKATPISEASADHVMNLLKDSVNKEGAYSARFKMESGQMAGKTGTANVVDSKNGGYLPGGDDRNYTYSFAGIAPAEAPEFVIMTSISRPQKNPTGATTTATKGLTDAINKYLSLTKRYDNVRPETNKETGVKSVPSFPSFINKRKEDVLGYLATVTKNEIVVVGDGDIVVNQNITPYTKYVSTQKIILRTNGNKITMPDFTGWSRKDIELYANFAQLKITFEGDGYGKEQGLKPGEEIKPEHEEILIKLSA